MFWVSLPSFKCKKPVKEVAAEQNMGLLFTDSPHR